MTSLTPAMEGQSVTLLHLSWQLLGGGFPSLSKTTERKMAAAGRAKGDSCVQRCSAPQAHRSPGLAPPHHSGVKDRGRPGSNRALCPTPQ